MILAETLETLRQKDGRNIQRLDLFPHIFRIHDRHVFVFYKFL